MKISTWSTLLFSSGFLMLVSSNTLSTEDHVNLITDLYNVYKPSSLTIIHFIDPHDISQINTIFDTIILFSRARVMTITLKLEQDFLPKDYTKTLTNAKKPMNVVFLSSERDISEKFDQYYDDLFLALQFAANFTAKNVEIKDTFGVESWNKTSKTWSGGMGLIQNHEIDILAHVVPSNNEILNSADLTVPLKKIELCLFIRRPTSEAADLWSSYFKPFTYKTWCAWIVTLIVIVTLLTLLRLKAETGLYHGGISENFLHVWGCYFQQGLPEFPQALALRLFYYSTFLFGFVIFAIYSASFVSERTVLQEHLPFKSSEEFLKDKSYKLAVIDAQLYDEVTADPIQLAMQKMLIKRNQSPRNTQDAMNLICSQKIALYSTDIITSQLPQGTKLPCNLVKIYLQRHIYIRMAMPKKSPYNKAINSYIIKLRGNGILKRIESVLQDSSSSRISLINAPTEQNYEPTTIFDIATLLAILCGSVILSILILFHEKGPLVEFEYIPEKSSNQGNTEQSVSFSHVRRFSFSPQNGRNARLRRRVYYAKLCIPTGNGSGSPDCLSFEGTDLRIAVEAGRIKADRSIIDNICILQQMGDIVGGDEGAESGVGSDRERKGDI
ncbi:uncharacterized protein LOC117178368 [Belonocnema kinseyi]|uniref:uncharacterized protein LOC117178368 n=1 Tax=Belonocnema kinseyi TaxID=2817044 RepID=UPI00143CDDA0|nr:uncharacterized protein LOC117178368 [Belonocnema kinseyi]